MELRANTTDRVCSECGKEIAAWVITFAWQGFGVALCDDHYDTLGTLSPKAKKPEKQTKPKRVVY